MTINSKKVAQAVKLDNALVPQSLNGAATSQFYSGAEFQKHAFAVAVGAMAAGNTVACQARSATDAAGTGAADISGALATIANAQNAQDVLLDFTTIVDGDSLTINGKVYTAEDTTPDASQRQFATGADDDAAMANLAAVIAQNDPNEFVLVPVGSSGQGNLRPADSGGPGVTVTDLAGTIAATTVKALAVVEIDSADLEEASAAFAAMEVTTNAALDVACYLLRMGGRYDPKVAGEETQL